MERAEIYINKGGAVMSERAIEAARMIDMLPDADQELVCELIKKVVLAWDPDFTKLTSEEAARLKEAEQEEDVPAEEVYRELGLS